MKVLTLLGTRPEIIRLSCVVERLDALCDHVLVHTGQNYEPALSDVFFEQLGVRAPDHSLGVRAGTFGERVGRILAATEAVLRAERPDRLLVLGDTDSGLATIVAKRMGARTFHMEAGNRCFDDRVPEEVNRRVIDHASDVLMPYTERSRANLLREGIGPDRVLVTGNPIKEVLDRHAAGVARSTVLADLGLDAHGYLLVTTHRQETVDVPARLARLVEAVNVVAAKLGMPTVVSLHPRARARLAEAGLAFDTAGITVHEPFDFFDFVHLEQHARCVLTDSGTVQEECCLFGVPVVTLRGTTERPETVECGSNVLAGVEPDAVLRCANIALSSPPRWSPPPEYLVPDVSATVAKIVLGR
ncbi:MAG: UDP-N-acetylglucosamine 2-epimerase (non-hydrolyzing) [Actinomycetota bacterium]